MEIPTIKNVYRGMLFSICLTVCASIYPIIHFLKNTKWPDFRSNAFIFVVVCLFLVILGMVLTISNFILMKQLKKLNDLKERESITVYQDAEVKFKESQKKKAKILGGIVAVMMFVLFFIVYFYCEIRNKT